MSVFKGPHPYREQFSEAQLDAMMDINFKGAFFTLQKLLPALRDGSGFAIDAMALSVLSQISSQSTRNAIWGTAVTHTRSRFIGIGNLITGDSYIFFREAYLQRRTELTGDPIEADPFGTFDDDPLSDD